jgi:hypothetical protein
MPDALHMTVELPLIGWQLGIRRRVPRVAAAPNAGGLAEVH